MQSAPSVVKSPLKPKTIQELLPELTGILSKEAINNLTAKKQPRFTIGLPRTNEKHLKPVTISEMRSNLQALTIQSPSRRAQPSTLVKKKRWNSSVKTDSKKVYDPTRKQNLKNSSVRKVLNFQPKPKAPMISKALIPGSRETPHFKKPEPKLKTPLNQRFDNVRISGVAPILETPIYNVKKCDTLTKKMPIANKENTAPSNKNIKCLVASNTHLNVLKTYNPVLDTPLSNDTIRSGGEASFIQKEKEIHDQEVKLSVMCEERTLENIADVSPPVSTPFKEYRNVTDFFNNSSDVDQSIVLNNTIMCFDKASFCNENNKREESVIVSLCDMLNKATVTNREGPTSDELDKLLELEKQIETSIEMLMKTKENHERALSKVRELIKDKRINRTSSDNQTLVTNVTREVFLTRQQEVVISENIQSNTPSVIVTDLELPPKRTDQVPCLRKTVLHKSMPANLNEIKTPQMAIGDHQALTMYRQLKQSMNFLNTPMTKRERKVELDTPGVTSHNIQKQLAKLFNES